jgi:tetratricopeptide (TPR) repeat protein
MGDITTDPLGQAQEAAARGDFQQAYDLLTEDETAQALGFEGLALLADVAYANGHLAVTFDAWERAHAQGVESGDDIAAATAAVRIAMHLLMDTGLLSPLRVWAKRAEVLLEGHDEAPVHAWLAQARAYERLFSGDFDAAVRWARRAVEVGTARNEPVPAAWGRVVEARGLIFAGQVDEGLELLDEAAAVTVSDQVDPLSIGMIYCELVCAWQALAQYDRAEEWTEAMERWCQRHSGLGSAHGRCRVHRAEILRQRGACGDAEREAQLACDELRPILRREFGWPLTELGQIRLQKGDLAGAEDAFVQARECGWEPQPGLALLHLAKGDVDAAVGSISDALDRPLGIPSKELPPNTELRRAPLLAAQVEISVAAGDLDQARSAADELGRVASTFESKALQASADFSRAHVLLASEDVSGARRGFERALAAWSDLKVPYEAARARGGLAETYQAEGDRPRAIMEFRTAASAFERIGAVLQAQRATRLAGSADPGSAVQQQRATQARPAGTGDADGSVGVFRTEGDYWLIEFGGKTVRLRDLKGLRYLARLLGDPGREFHVLDLTAAEYAGPAGPPVRHDPGLHAMDPSDAGPVLDAQAKETYRRRLTEIEEDIEEAEAFGDSERAARATVDRDYLIRELSRAVGLGGCERRTGAASERARVSVTRAVRHALGRIDEQHPQLGAHLAHAVRTGTYCAYAPDPRMPVMWELG